MNTRIHKHTQAYTDNQNKIVQENEKLDKINTSSKYSHCFDEMEHSMLMLFVVRCQLRCHYHRKRLNQLPDYSIHQNKKRDQEREKWKWKGEERKKRTDQIK